MGAWAGGADSSGYLNSARLLAHGEISAVIRPVAGVDAETLPGYGDYIYTPLGFRPTDVGGLISPIYPIGLPLLIVAVAGMTNWIYAAGLTVGIHAILGVLLVYALGRESGLSRGWSALGCVLLGLSPLYHFMSLQMMSDVPALVWATGAVLCAWRARQHPAWAPAAGFALGFAVLVRPTNALALLPALIALGWNAPRLLLFALGGLPAVATLARYNLLAYGNIFTIGYFNPADSFALHRVDSTLWFYAIWLPVLLTPLMLAAWLLPWARDLSVRWRLILGSWVLVFFLFYSTYVFTHQAWWFLRFLLPAFPPLIVAALHVLHGYAGRQPGRVSPRLAWIAVALMIFIQGMAWTRTLRALRVGEDERAYKVTASWLQDHLPPQAIVCTMQDSGALFYYTDFTLVRSDLLQPDQFRALVQVAHASGRPIYAALQNFEQDDTFQKHLPGNWAKVERVRVTTIWKLVSQ